jgi:N-acetylmuramoyl-L-alanine amidase
LDRGNDMQPGAEWHSGPIGIIYHATESPLYPFDRDQNANLQRVGKALASLVREKRSYNFLIDRFGRVFRIVEETDAANHAGNSVWAAGRSLYLNLNSSFLAVAFETATDTQTGSSTITNAQVHAGRNLTQMLRGKYKIPAENCITHAQVSVNPANMRIGYHTDWAAMFPFAEMGLPNNYDLPVASVSEFGFEYDELFRKAVGERTWTGLAAAERQLERAAARLRVGIDEHRRGLQERYKRLFSALKLTGALDEPVP